MITTEDGKQFTSSVCKCVGSVKKVKSKELSVPPVVGEYPVFVEQSGSYPIFTYSSKIKEIG